MGRAAAYVFRGRGLMLHELHSTLLIIIFVSMFILKGGCSSVAQINNNFKGTVTRLWPTSGPLEGQDGVIAFGQGLQANVSYEIDWGGNKFASSHPSPPPHFIS